jgi:hypothetical protein
MKLVYSPSLSSKMAFSSRASPSIAGLRVPPLTSPPAGPPTRRHLIRAAFWSRWWREAESRRDAGRGCTIGLQVAASSSSPSPTSSSTSSPSPTSSPASPSSPFSSLPEGCLLVDAADARAVGGEVVPLNSLVLIRAPADEGDDDEEEAFEPGVEPGEDAEGGIEDVAVAVLRASDALDLSAAARRLGWPRARLAPRGDVPRLLRFRFAPGGVPPLGHAGGIETLVCSRVVLPAGEERGAGDGGGGGSPRAVSFVGGGGSPSLRLVFRGRGALAAAMEAEGAAVVSGLGVERPPLVLPAPTAASSDGEGADGSAASSPAAAAPQGGPVYSSPPPLFVDDAAGVGTLAELLLPPPPPSSKQQSSDEAPTEETGGASGSGGGSGSGGRSNRQRWHLLGVDAEWAPETERGASGRHPVETLQLATAGGVAAVLDVAALSRSRAGSEALVALLSRAATAGTAAAGEGGGESGSDSTRVLFVGHSARQDMVRLARTVAEASAARGEGPRREDERGGGRGGEGGGGRGGERGGEGGGERGGEGGGGGSGPPRRLPLLTLPNLPVHAVDLPSLARWAVSPAGALVPAGRLPGGHGLANLVRTFLGGATLDKECQRSDWARRPLSERQLVYAAADAHAAVAVAARILDELRPELASTRKRAAAHSGGLVELDGGFSRGSGRGRGSKGGAGRKGSAPLPPLAPGPARDARRVAREERHAAFELGGVAGGDLEGGGSPSSLVSSSSASNYLGRGAARGSRRSDMDAGGTPRPKSSGGSAADADADVEGLLRDFLGLPLPGRGGRGLAVAAALGLLKKEGGPRGERASPSSRRRGGGDDEEPPPHLAVPRFDRGGVARLRNACVLFVNLDAGGGGGASRYPNEFVEEKGETRLTWFPSPGQGERFLFVFTGFRSAGAKRGALSRARERRRKDRTKRREKSSPFPLSTKFFLTKASLTLLSAASSPRRSPGDRSTRCCSSAG